MRPSTDIGVWEPLILEKLIVTFFKRTRVAQVKFYADNEIPSERDNGTNLMAVRLPELQQLRDGIDDLLSVILGQGTSDKAFLEPSMFQHQLSVANNAFVDVARNNVPPGP